MLGTRNRRVVTPALAVGVLLAAAGTALAAGGTLHVKVGPVNANTTYKVTVHGSAPTRDHLYLFIDSKSCTRSPAGEYARTGPFGTAYGYYWATVNGNFTRTASFRTTAVLSDRACVYLTKHTTGRNSSNGVLTHNFKAYQVQ